MTRFKNKLSNCQMTCSFNKKLGAFAIRLSKLFHFKNDLAFFLNGKLCIITKPENTHHRGKYQCTADFLFDWFGCDQTGKFDANST